MVRSIMVSGGSIDADAPDYNEGRRGLAQLVTDHADDWALCAESRGDPLGARVIVDPYAMHSVSNVRNVDRLSVLLGLDRNLIVTTAGTLKQGWWFTHDPPIGSFDSACQSQLGYTLGRFEEISPGPTGDNIFGTGRDVNPSLPEPAIRTMVIAHCDLATASLLADPTWA